MPAIQHHRSGRGCPTVSQEFLIALTEPRPLATPPPTVADPTLRAILQRHRCRLELLGVSQRRPADPLASFALIKRRVRVTGPDDAAIRRCCRLLAVRFPEFANRTPATATATATATASTSGRLRNNSTEPRSQPVARGGERGSLTGRPVATGLSVNLASRLQLRDSIVGDSYSAFFTASQDSRAQPSPNGVSSISSSMRPMEAATDPRSISWIDSEGDSSEATVTCATVTIRIDGRKKAASVTAAQASRRDAPTKSAGQGGVKSRPRRPSNRNNDSGDHRVGTVGKLDICVQTSPRLTLSAWQSRGCLPTRCPLWPGLAQPSTIVAMATESSLSTLEQVSGRVLSTDPVGHLPTLPTLPTLPQPLRASAGPRGQRGRTAHKRITWFLKRS